MRILFLTPEVPYPPDSGGRLKTWTLLEYIRAQHEVTLLCFRREDNSSSQTEWAAALPRFRTLPLNRGRDPLTLARSYVNGVPLSIERNRLAGMASMVEEELAQRDYDAIFVDHWLMAQYLPESFGGIRVLHEHNAEYVIWERQAARSTNPLVKREAARVRKYEERIAERFDRVFCVSESDRTALGDLGIEGGRLGVLPNIPDPRLLDFPLLEFSTAPLSIVYVGTLSWQPNIDGLERFLTSVFPLVRDRLADARFLLAGRGSPKKLEVLARKTRGVEFLGAIGNAEGLYQRGRVLVEATTSGGGTKLKILNALARGLPVVTSPEAADGLDVTDGENVLISRSDVLMAESLLRVMTDAGLWRRLSEGGRSLVREKYVAEVAFRPLDEVLSKAQVRR